MCGRRMLNRNPLKGGNDDDDDMIMILFDLKFQVCGSHLLFFNVVSTDTKLLAPKGPYFCSQGCLLHWKELQHSKFLRTLIFNSGAH